MRPVLQLVGQSGSELTGVAFNPRGDRMYVSSQRGSDRAAGLGITYEIRGPFHARTGRYADGRPTRRADAGPSGREAGAGAPGRERGVVGRGGAAAQQVGDAAGDPRRQPLVACRRRGR